MNLRAKLQELAALPADRPKAMPGAYYTSQKHFEHEAATVLRQGWHCLGRADEVPEPGDFFTSNILNEPLIAVRGDEYQIRVLANVCRHRGMQLANGQGNVKRFVCPYHAWAYGRDGSLTRATRMENADFDADNCRLFTHNAQLWNGFIYVNLDRNAPRFSHPDLDALLESYEPEQFRLVHTAEENWRTNWKCLVENFMEGYHLSVVHPRTLSGYTPTGLARKAASGDGFTSYSANYPQDIPSRGKGASGLNDEQRQRSTLFSIFPTHVASQAASLLVSLSIFPVKADLITVKWTMSVYGDDLNETMIAERIKLWEEVNREDREKLEQMQISLRSEHAQEGPLAGEDFEGTIRDFQSWLAQMDALTIDQNP